jgi:hypothetical protein
MQEIRRLKPSTVSRRMSIVAGFYRTAGRCQMVCVQDPSLREYTRDRGAGSAVDGAGLVAGLIAGA